MLWGIHLQEEISSCSSKLQLIPVHIIHKYLQIKNNRININFSKNSKRLVMIIIFPKPKLQMQLRLTSKHFYLIIMIIYYKLK